jgi:hypothetical protein
MIFKNTIKRLAKSQFSFYNLCFSKKARIAVIENLYFMHLQITIFFKNAFPSNSYSAI